MGRPKASRPTNTNVAQKVLAAARAEKTWLALIDLEKRRLGISGDGELLPVTVTKGKDGAADVITGPDYQGKFSIIPLSTLLRYLEDRAYGKPMDTVNHIHDKPIDVNMKVSLAGAISEARKRVVEGKSKR
jgi:hypothetical protein